MRPLSLAALLGALALPAAASTEPVRLAVILDDFGLTYPSNPPDEEWLALPWPVTIAVMPESPRTRKVAAAAKAAGKEVLVHFPFDPFLSLELSEEAPTEGDKRKVLALLQKAVQEIPGAVGLNNHRSYAATRNRPLMRWFMGELKGRGLFFVDSWVSARSVAYEEARGAGLRAARGDGFLDEAKRHDKESCLRWLDIAAARAKRRGYGVAIGHHYFPGTLECLKEGLPRLESRGFKIVPASEVVR